MAKSSSISTAKVISHRFGWIVSAANQISPVSAHAFYQQVWSNDILICRKLRWIKQPAHGLFNQLKFYIAK